jgi:hypothetical protein
MCPDGGLVQAGPVVILVPEGALEACVELTVEEEPEHPAGSVGRVYRIGPEGTAVKKPLLLTIHQEADGIPGLFAYAELALASVSEGAWKLNPDFAADAANLTVSGNIEHLGVWGILPHVKVDLLWVTENGVDMLRMEAGMVAGMHRVVERLKAAAPHLSLRLASTTPAASNTMGRFTTVPRSVEEGRPVLPFYPCTDDDDCKAAFGNGWKCFGSDLVDDDSYGFWSARCYFPCTGAGQCCQPNCTPDLCPSFFPCGNDSCFAAGASDCPFDCAGQNQSDFDEVICRQLPPTSDCPNPAPSVLVVDSAIGVDESNLFKCISLTDDYDRLYGHVTNDHGFKAAWRALNPAGPHAEQAKSFVRDDALLLVVFVAYDAECSVDDDFCSPNWPCQHDSDCPSVMECKVDLALSKIQGQTTKLCCGGYKQDYYRRCQFLGDYKGGEHHVLAYDKEQVECTSDDDCDEFWFCAGSKKCRSIFLPDVPYASYQSPPGYPFHSLWAVADVKQALEGLKPSPGQLLIASVVGDALLTPGPYESVVSQSCMESGDLPGCAAYAAAIDSASPECLENPQAAGCETFAKSKLDCVRQCWMANATDMFPSDDPAHWVHPICGSALGQAELGLRYLELADQLGDRGFSASICAPDGAEKVMDDLGDWLKGKILASTTPWNG